ncbi:MAG: hypothetical protein ACPGLV_03135 [Bacteroidia bacterium]
MRFKNISDTEIASLIKKGDYSILPFLFERNYVNSLNIGENNGCTQAKVQKVLSNSVVIVWQYFSIKSFQVSKHKFDFMIDFVFRTLLQSHVKESTIKIKSRYNELKDLIQQKLNEPKESEVSNVLNNFKVLKENQKQLIWNHFFEKLSIEKAGNKLGLSEDKSIDTLFKGFVKWSEFIKQNLNKNINTNLLKENIESFICYSTASLTNDKMITHELLLANNPDAKKLQGYVDEMGEIACLSRRLSLVDYIAKNASTKLTGNIWGNKVSIYSAIFIVIMGVLVWVSENTPDDKKDIFNFNNSPSVSDTLNIKNAED